MTGAKRVMGLVALAAAGSCARGEAPAPQPLPPPLPLGDDGPAPSATAEPARDVDRGRLELSVEEALLMALGQNRDLQTRQLTPAVSGAFAEIARARYDPELFARLQAGMERSVETARSTEQQFDVEGSSVSGAVGVRQEIASGTTVELSVEQGAVDSTRTPGQQSARIGLTLTQALLRGFGPSVNLAAVEQADLEVQASAYELRGYVEALLADTEVAYWRYVLASRRIAIYEESLAVARQQSDEIGQEIEVGTLPKTELAAARAEVALREQELIEARSNRERQRLQLLRLLGEDLRRAVVATSDPTIDPNGTDDLAERLELAGRSRPEISEALLRLEQRRLETVVTRNGLLPRLDIFVALGKTGFASDFGGSFRQLGGDTFDIFGGLSFSGYVRNRAADGAERAAVASHRQAALALENLRQIVALEVRLAQAEVERARQQIDASAATRALQEQKVIAEQERFRVGESTALLLAQAQRDLLSSRIAEVQALVDYRNAIVQLDLADGSLIERRGIRLDR